MAFSLPYSSRFRIRWFSTGQCTPAISHCIISTPSGKVCQKIVTSRCNAYHPWYSLQISSKYSIHVSTWSLWKFDSLVTNLWAQIWFLTDYKSIMKTPLLTWVLYRHTYIWCLLASKITPNSNVQLEMNKMYSYISMITTVTMRSFLLSVKCPSKKLTLT